MGFFSDLLGAFTGSASRDAAEQQVQALREAQNAITQARREATQELKPRFEDASAIRREGYQPVFDIMEHTSREKARALQDGLVRAQSSVTRGGQQAANAILGKPVDFAASNMGRQNFGFGGNFPSVNLSEVLGAREQTQQLNTQQNQQGNDFINQIMRNLNTRENPAFYPRGEDTSQNAGYVDTYTEEGVREYVHEYLKNQGYSLEEIEAALAPFGGRAPASTTPGGGGSGGGGGGNDNGTGTQQAAYAAPATSAPDRRPTTPSSTKHSGTGGVKSEPPSTGKTSPRVIDGDTVLIRDARIGNTTIPAGYTLNEYKHYLNKTGKGDINVSAWADLLQQPSWMKEGSYF